MKKGYYKIALAHFNLHLIDSVKGRSIGGFDKHVTNLQNIK